MTILLRVLLKIRFTTYRVAGIGITIILIGALAFWFRSPIINGYQTVEEIILRTVGLGIVLIALCVAICSTSLKLRLGRIHRLRLFGASLTMLWFCLGIMAIFQPITGPLSWWTLGGAVSLSGKVGSLVLGDSLILSIAQLSALFFATIFLITPAIIPVISMGFVKISIIAYVLIIFSCKATLGLLQTRRKQKGDQPNRLLANQSTLSLKGEASPSSNALTANLRTTITPGSSNIVPSKPIRHMSDENKKNIDHMVDLQDSQYQTESEDQVDLSKPDEFHRFWGSDAPKSSDQPNQGKEDAYTARSTRVFAVADNWNLPPKDILHDGAVGGISKDEISKTAEMIKTALAEYDVDVEIGQIQPGPTVTMYGLIPGWIRRYKQTKSRNQEVNKALEDSGKPLPERTESKTRVKVDHIISREKDLALALKTPSLRIETPAMGESLVGIEVPNPTPSLVTIKSVMGSDKFQSMGSTGKLPIALGKGSDGQEMVVDLAKMPHLLVAGATGSGKSVCINTIISCLIMEKTPSEVRLLLVDPKRVELTPFNGIPHLITPVVVETDQVVTILKGLIREMLQRYRRMEEKGVRNIDAFNRNETEKMPYLVVAVDELADLMMSASFDVERSLCRLAQLGRATGIHLIVATQRPSVDVVTGLIKANFPSRISFGVTSQIDSRTILDSVGAEKLLGRGDMLYQGVEDSRPARVQGVYISDDETSSLVNFWQNTPWATLPNISLHTEGDGDEPNQNDRPQNDDRNRDALLDNAIELVNNHKKISTSLLQRRLRIGYPRAARLMDQLEDEGVVGPSNGSKSRDVIIDTT